jgi:hypothetical protein
VLPYIDASYEGSIGKIVFSPDGSYTLAATGTEQRGRYAFFMLDNQELLEVRPLNNGAGAHETYRVERSDTEEADAMTLERFRLGTRGVQELHEAALSLARSP